MTEVDVNACVYCVHARQDHVKGVGRCLNPECEDGCESFEQYIPHTKDASLKLPIKPGY